MKQGCHNIFFSGGVHQTQKVDDHWTCVPPLLIMDVYKLVSVCKCFLFCLLSAAISMKLDVFRPTTNKMHEGSQK